jgi:hypothetical protein
MASWVRDIQGGFQSSSGKTPEFMSFVKKFNKEFKETLNELGAKNIDIHTGHFYLSGFFDIDDQVWYFSTGDVRWLTMPSMLVRKAKDHVDYSGGCNQFVEYRHDFNDNLKELLNNSYLKSRSVRD